MREAAADLNFEEAARLRDEVKRLRATELAVIDDPTAKHASSGKAPSPSARAARRFPLPQTAEGAEPRSGEAGEGSRVRKPALDEMGPSRESAPYRPDGRSRSGKPGAYRGKRR